MLYSLLQNVFMFLLYIILIYIVNFGATYLRCKAVQQTVDKYINNNLVEFGEFGAVRIIFKYKTGNYIFRTRWIPIRSKYSNYIDYIGKESNISAAKLIEDCIIYKIIISYNVNRSIYNKYVSKWRDKYYKPIILPDLRKLPPTPTTPSSTESTSSQIDDAISPLHN